MSFKGYSIQEPDAATREQLKNEILHSRDAPLLMLDTCQRLEVYGIVDGLEQDFQVVDYFDTKAAFLRLTRIAAGLESRILGELEVLGQVRNAYKAFLACDNPDIIDADKVFQDILSLARKARRESGIDTQMTSLSGLTAKSVLSKITKGAPVAVIGSGQLASSIVRYLGKRGESPVRVSSRCPEKALELAKTVNGFSKGLDELVSLLVGVEGIICATAAPHPVLYPHHLVGSNEKVVVADLGVPADCSICLQHKENVEYIPLERIEEKALVNLEDREKRAEHAAHIIDKGVSTWLQSK